MSTSSDAKAKISLDSTDFVQGAKNVTAAANAMSTAVVGAFAVAGAAALAAFGAETVSAIVHSIKSVIDLGEEMANAGKKAGLAAGQFYLFNNAIEKGLSLKTVANLIGENAEVLNRSASVFRDVAIKLWAVGEKVRGFWLGLVDQIAPVLSRLLDGALGVSLVQAGEAFGETMINAVKVVYQMLIDGDLWKNVAALAVGVFTYAANIFSGLIEIATTKAFGTAFENFISYGGTALAWFGENFGKVLIVAFVKFEAAFLGFWIKLFGKLAQILSGPFGDSKAVTNLVNGAAALPFKGAKVFSDFVLGDNKGPTFDKKASVPDQLKELFANTKFEIPGTEGKPGEKLTDIFQKYLDEFNKTNTFFNTPAKQFENNNRQKTFGVDSLAAIGAGGNVSLGLSVLDVNKQQLDQLRDINRKLTPAPVKYLNTVSLNSDNPDYISRAQQTGVVNTP